MHHRRPPRGRHGRNLGGRGAVGDVGRPAPPGDPPPRPPATTVASRNCRDRGGSGRAHRRRRGRRRDRRGRGAAAGGVESDSEHPLARAIVTAARDRGAVATATEFRSLTGRGVEATIDGTAYAVGGPALLRQRSLAEPDELSEWSARWRDRGASILYLTRDDAIVGGIALEDEIRTEARHAVAELQAMGRRTVMITGDARQVADAVGADLGIDEVMAEVLPEDKDAKVAELQARHLKVAMVGDGVNDAPALARADVGIAIGAGTDVAIESAGLILASSDPRAVVSIIRLSKAAYRKSLQNLWWAAGYNVLAIPIAAGALGWAGITMPPAVAAILMSVSTIVVALNAQLLRRVELRPPALADDATPRPSAEAVAS
ncbi:HAD-IC family P-type ATPase [Actinomarinicola tropica]|uniref:HAD-IC family P-type ATPase n=1 Tax=Actinomarinicola tropica TaxID=2789776 RepID=A0A5Q2RK12_9ACTN|nr:HAD-IC family P-type ATPase [Actinomarinicola tropica]